MRAMEIRRGQLYAGLNEFFLSPEQWCLLRAVDSTLLSFLSFSVPSSLTFPTPFILSGRPVFLYFSRPMQTNESGRWTSEKLKKIGVDSTRERQLGLSQMGC